MPRVLSQGLGTAAQIVTQGYSSNLASAANSSLFTGGLGVGQRLVTQGYGPTSTLTVGVLRLACVSLSLVPGTSVAAVLRSGMSITAELEEC